MVKATEKYMSFVFDESIGCLLKVPVTMIALCLVFLGFRYNGDFSRLLDLARGSIVFPTVSAVQAGLEAIFDDEQVQVSAGDCKSALVTSKFFRSPG